MKIEFGCGDKPSKAGFKTCDIRNLPGIDFVCVAWEIDKHVNEESVEEVWSRHFFEHLTFIQGEIMLATWFKILKPGGKLEMSLPNIDFHIKQWLDNKNLEHARAGFWGWQREGDIEMWDVHKSGYNFKQLEILLKKYNFVNIKNLKNNKHREIHILCNKPFS